MGACKCLGSCVLFARVVCVHCGSSSAWDQTWLGVLSLPPADKSSTVAVNESSPAGNCRRRHRRCVSGFVLERIWALSGVCSSPALTRALKDFKVLVVGAVLVHARTHTHKRLLGYLSITSGSRIRDVPFSYLS